MLFILWVLARLNTATFLATIPALLLGRDHQSAMTSSTPPSTISWHIPTAKSCNQVVLANCLVENVLDHFYWGGVVLDSVQHIEVTKLGHIEHGFKHVFELSTGADAETLGGITNILVSKCPYCIKLLAASKHD